MIGASSLALTVYLAVTALANVFGTGGGSLMARLIGEKRLMKLVRLLLTVWPLLPSVHLYFQ